MYEEFYGLTEKPFSIQPDPSFIYWGRAHRLAYAMLEYGVINRAGISVVTGEVGCGKTTLIHRLLEQLSDTHTVALLSNIQSGRGELLSWVLMAFGEPFAGKSHIELFAQLQDFFIREYSKGRRIVLIIDEAQNLSVDMLEELRMLSNINAGKDQLLQLILVGQPQLKEILSRPDMLQLAQRVGADFHLTPLSREEVRAYIDTRLTIAGARRRIFSERAMDLVAEQSRGVPRVINIIADTALVYGFSSQELVVDEPTVRSVIRDKLDYGVFGLASNPHLKLSESPAANGQDSFLAEAPAAATTRPPVATVNMMPLAPQQDFERSSEPPGGPSLYPDLYPRPARSAGAVAATRTSVQAVDAAIADRGASDSQLVAVRVEPKLAATPVESPKPDIVPAPQPRPTANSGIGVIILAAADEERVAAVVADAPADARILVVAPLGSPAATSAVAAGLEVVDASADALLPGKAKNVAYRRLKKSTPGLKYVQFVAGGDRLSAGWLDFAARFMARRPEVAALEGRRQYAEALRTAVQRQADSVTSDADGETQATGDTVLFRAESFETAGGFRNDLPASEVADLCIRLRKRGLHVWRVEEQMAVSPPPAKSLAAWWRERRRNGYLTAFGAALHGAPPERYLSRELLRALVWGGLAPLFTVVASVVSAVSVLIFEPLGNPIAAALSVFGICALIFGGKIAFKAVALGPFRAQSWAIGALTVLSRVAEFGGVLRYWTTRRPVGAP